MHLLVLGSGAREHAISHKLTQSSLVRKIYVWPGNTYTKLLFETIPLDSKAAWREAVVKAKSLGIDAIVVGPEGALAEGIADYGAEVGIPVFGPSQAAAKLEASKAISKQIMFDAGIPTAHFKVVQGKDQCRTSALHWLEEKKGVVIKASGLAAGKGVFVCFTRADVEEAVTRLYQSMAEAAETVVLEDILVGREASFFCMLGEGKPHVLGFAVDYKRLKDGNQGPNTGGMGCYTPVPWLPEHAEDQVMKQVVDPLLRELRKRAMPYTGWLYVGLMWDKDKLSVVEFNVRLGDPEAEVLALADDTDWGMVIAEKLGLKASEQAAKPSAAHGAAVAVVMASAGYPYGEGERNPQRVPLEKFTDDSAHVFVAAVGDLDKNNNALSTGRGRVFTVSAKGSSLREARDKAYQKVESMAGVFSDAQWRRDIAEGVEAP